MTGTVVDDVLSLIGLAVLLPIILGSKSGSFSVDMEKLVLTFLDVLAFLDLYILWEGLLFRIKRE
jgi:hypothetical protein